jgi:outer membrane protein TolC
MRFLKLITPTRPLGSTPWANNTPPTAILASNAPGGPEFWNRDVILTTPPVIPTGTMDSVEKHVDVALRLRPELNETKLSAQRGDLEIVQTKNGLLPRLDLFLNLGRTGFASSFGESIKALDGPDYSAILGVKGDWSPINRAAQASYRAALLSRQQVEDSYNNLVQSVELDVRTQYVEVDRLRQQIDATKATRIAREADLKVQQAKLRAGSGTSLLVSLAQRDLLVAQLSEVLAVTQHLKALVELYRLEGSLLYRRGLDAPGGQPVEDIAWRR